MKKNSRKPQPRKKGVTHGKQRFRIVDPAALIISLFVAAVMASLAVLFNRSGFDATWYGDLLTTAVCIIGFFALLNIGYVLMEGITVENGVAFLGVDSEKQPIGFAVGELAEITLRDADGNSLPDDRKHWSHAVICFVLQDGSEREYRAHWLTKNQYQSIRAYFEHRSH